MKLDGEMGSGLRNKIMYKDKEFLVQKYIIEGLSVADIGFLCNIAPYAITCSLKKFDIEIRKPTMWTESRRKKMIGASHPRFGKINSLEMRKKISEGLLKLNYENPNRTPKGEKSHNWRGGVDSVNRAIRDTHEIDQWKKEVFERDNYTCQFCNKRGGKCHIDHIKPLSTIITEHSIRSLEDARKCKEIWDTSNGRVLCVDCHKKTESYGSNQYTALYSKEDV